MCSTYISSYIKHRNVKCRDMTKGTEGSRKSNHPEVLHIFEDPWPHILGSFFVSVTKYLRKINLKEKLFLLVHGFAAFWLWSTGLVALGLVMRQNIQPHGQECA